MRHPTYFPKILTIITVLGALLFNAIPGGTAYGQNSAVQMSASAAFDGNFKYGEWLPMWVELQNSGPDLEGELQARVASSSGNLVFATPASLPTGSHKRIPLYVLPNNFSHALEIELVVDHKSVASTQVTLQGLPNINYLVGVVAAERGALSIVLGAEFSGLTRTKAMVDVSLADMPERLEGLRSFDLLIFNDVDTSALTPGQKAALENWVYQGGRLVIGGGPGAQKTISGLPASLLPLTPNRQVDLDELPGLGEYTAQEAPRVPGPFIAAAGEAANGQVKAQQDGLPLVVERQVGAGSVDFVALDLSSSPFDAWSGAADFWSVLISPGAGYPEWLPPDMSARQMMSGQMSYALSNLPSLDLPSIRGLTILLIIYVILVGPVNYLILRWRKRLQWAWVTIPVITLLFSAGAFSLGYLLRGNDLILNKVVLVEAHPDGSALSLNYYGLFSPAQQSYVIEMANNDLLSPLNASYDPWSSGGGVATGETVFVQSEKAAMRGLSVNQWSMQTFMTEGTLPDLGGIESDIMLDGQKVTGTVKNNTALTLEDAVVIFGSQFTRLGTLAPGQQVEIDFNIGSLGGPDFGPPLSYRLFENELNTTSPNGPPRSVQLKQSVLDNVFQWAGGMSPSMNPKAAAMGQGASSSALLLGWFSDDSRDVLVSGRPPAQQSTGLLYARLDYRFPSSGELVLPPGVIPGRVTEVPLEGGMCGATSTPAVYLGRGSGVFEFQIPPEMLDVKISEIEIGLATDGGWNQPPNLSIYDWSKSEFTTLENVIIGVNVLPNPDNLVSDSGLVKARLSSDSNFGGGCFFLSLGMKGTR